MRELLGFFPLLCIALALGIIVWSQRPPATEPTAAVNRLPESPKVINMVTREEMGIHTPTAEESKPTCELSVEETIQLAEQCKICALNKLKGKTVDWVVTNLEVVNTGSFYQAHYGMWDVSVFLAHRGDYMTGDCVPDLNGNGHWRIRATIGDYGAYRIRLDDAVLYELEAPDPVAEEPTLVEPALTEDDIAEIDFQRVEGDITTIIRSP